MNTTDNHTMHSLLVRDWFVDEEGVLEILERADDNTLQFFRENAKQYSDRVRYIVAPDMFTCSVKPRMKCCDLTDAMMEKMASDDRRAQEIEFEKRWQIHKKTIGERPQADVDDMLDDAWDLMQHAMNAVKNYKSSKYVPPSQRTVKDPKLEKLENDLQTRENEFKRIQDLVNQTDNDWIQNKRDEFRRTALF